MAIEAGAAIVSKFAYEKDGQLKSFTDPLGRVTSYGYDALGRLSTVTMPDPDGQSGQLPQVITYTYDRVGNVLKVDGGLNDVTAYFYDHRDRLVPQIDANNISSAAPKKTFFEYDAASNVTKLTDAEGNATVFAYDGLDQLTSETDAFGKSTFYEYDANGNLIEQTDRNGRVTQYDYDNLDRLTEEDWLDNKSNVARAITYTYDLASQLTKASDPDSTYAYAYDLLGRVKTVDNSGTPGVPNVVLTSSYDIRSNRTGLSAKIGGVDDFSNSYSYDALSRQTQVTQTGSGVAPKTVDFGYDAASQLTSIDRLAGSTSVATSKFTYDNAGRLTNLSHKAGSTTIADYAWNIDQIGRVTSFTNAQHTTENVTYAYDTTGQLTGADRSGTSADESYTFDDTGNRTMSGYQTIAGNRMASDGTYWYVYDANGNTVTKTKISDGSTTEYAWDYRNRLTEVTFRDGAGNISKVVAYTYDVFDRRIARAVDDNSPYDLADAAIERYVYDGADVVLDFADPDGTGSEPMDLSHRYMYGPVVDMLLAQENISEQLSDPDRVVWLLGDNQNTTRDLVDSTGTILAHYQYDSFGRPTDGDLTLTRYLYTGREWDIEISLQYNRARYYDPAVGRWISEDPIGFQGGDYNLERYVANGSTNAIDPTGLAPPYETTFEATVDAVNNLSWRDWFRIGKKAMEDKNRAQAEAMATASTRAEAFRRGDRTWDNFLGTFQETAGMFDAFGGMVGSVSGPKGGSKVPKPNTKSSATSKPCPPTEGIYEFPDQSASGRPYVGQSENIPQRLGQHKAAGRLKPGTESTTPVAGGQTAREIAEHQRIQQLTGGQKAKPSPAVSNQKDPIGPKRRPGVGLPDPK